MCHIRWCKLWKTYIDIVSTKVTFWNFMSVINKSLSYKPNLSFGTSCWVVQCLESVHLHRYIITNVMGMLLQIFFIQFNNWKTHFDYIKSCCAYCNCIIVHHNWRLPIKTQSKLKYLLNILSHLDLSCFKLSAPDDCSGTFMPPIIRNTFVIYK